MPTPDLPSVPPPTRTPHPDRVLMVRATRTRIRVIEETCEQAVFAHPSEAPPFSDSWRRHLTPESWVRVDDADIAPPRDEHIGGVVASTRELTG
jgi:hypothetical protein